MQTYDLSPGWRISADERQYVLERLRKAKKEQSAPRWSAVGYHGKLSDALEHYAEEAIRVSDRPLPEAVRQVRDDLQTIAGVIGKAMTIL